MNYFASFFAVLLFSMACNLDTVILSMAYALRGTRLSMGGTVVIAVITTGVTWLSLALGDMAAAFLGGAFSDMLGGLVLVGIGAWFLLDYLRQIGKSTQEDVPPQAPSPWACVPLAAALAVNNAGVGVAAGVSGISPLWAAAANFLVTLLFLPLGRLLGTGALGRFLGRYALPLSGLLLILLGAGEAFF